MISQAQGAQRTRRQRRFALNGVVDQAVQAQDALKGDGQQQQHENEAGNLGSAVQVEAAVLEATGRHSIGVVPVRLICLLEKARQLPQLLSRPAASGVPGLAHGLPWEGACTEGAKGSRSAAAVARAGHACRGIMAVANVASARAYCALHCTEGCLLLPAACRIHGDLLPIDAAGCVHREAARAALNSPIGLEVLLLGVV